MTNLPPGTILPLGVVSLGGGRYQCYHKSSQVYFGLLFAVVGLIVPIVILSNLLQRDRIDASIAAVFIVPLIFVGVGVFFCYRFKWSRMIMDFNSRQVNYIVAPFPFILCQQPNQSCSIDNLANLHIHDTGVRSGGRRGHGGAPILEVQILVNGSTTNAIPLASCTGHFNAAPVMNQWTIFLQTCGINVAPNAQMQQQLLAISPMMGMGVPMMMMPGQPTMMMQSQPPGGNTYPGSPMMIHQHNPQSSYPGSPMNQSPPYGAPPPPPHTPGSPMYGAPPPPPPPPGAAMPGFATYENTATGGGNYNYAPPPTQQY